jgi:hypothetical protein
MAGTYRTTEVDLVILELVRSATAEPWNPRRAAAQLRSKQHTKAALRVALSRVRAAQADGVAGPIPDRCAATIGAVLDSARDRALAPLCAGTA